MSLEGRVGGNLQTSHDNSYLTGVNLNNTLGMNGMSRYIRTGPRVRLEAMDDNPKPLWKNPWTYITGAAALVTVIGLSLIEPSNSLPGDPRCDLGNGRYDNEKCIVDIKGPNEVETRYLGPQSND